MAQQKQGGKPNFNSFKKANGNGGKKKEKKSPKGFKPKRTPAHENHLVQTARGYCEARCGVCVSCIIAKSDEENQRRISDSYQSYGGRYA